jgi:ribosome maturation factor RimP
MTKVERIEQIAQPIVTRHDCDIVQLMYRREQVGWVLRVLIERRGADLRNGSGVDHALCAAVSRELGAALDAEEFLAEAFVLEVSSPGIERPLTKLVDYVRFAGREARVETTAPMKGRKRFRGVIGGACGDEISISLADGEVVNVAIGRISKAHLVYDNGGMHFKAGER